MSTYLLSDRLCQLSYTRFIVLAETITGTAVAKEFIGKYSSHFLSFHRRICIGENTLKGDPLNLRQAIDASCHYLAYRQTGDQRVVVDRGQEFLAVHVQRRSKKHWIADDGGGGVRYLAGVLRDGMGRYLYLCPSDDLSDIEQVRTLLPLCYQALLLPACDDWHAMEQGDL